MVYIDHMTERGMQLMLEMSKAHWDFYLFTECAFAASFFIRADPVDLINGLM